ncbi:unnamed protein product [Prorocentrum cordatum]|uniref:Uncharacterized protein n=1 Tax=Prorocentrum cordatum TaxID=2364126 RepID=A0ABN9W0Y6_9DINO|nr:unnamed protein product [Polarella glacialis]
MFWLRARTGARGALPSLSAAARCPGLRPRMGKKRKGAPEQGPEAEQGAGGKRAKGKGRPADLTDGQLEERERELAEDLRRSRWERERVRGQQPPNSGRIAWQREVTVANNRLHRVESLYNEVLAEMGKRGHAAVDAAAPLVGAAAVPRPGSGGPGLSGQ